MSADDLYQQILLAHARHSCCSAALDTVPTHHAALHNPLCGDELQLEIVQRDGVLDLACRVRGCVIVQASASLLCAACRRRTPAEAVAICGLIERMLEEGAASVETALLGEAAALEAVCRFPSRLRCALLPWEALRQALS